MLKYSNDLRRDLEFNSNNLNDLNSKKSSLDTYEDYNLKLSEFLKQLDYSNKSLYSQTRFTNNLQDLTQSDEINNIWIDSIKYLRDLHEFAQRFCWHTG